MWGTNGMWSQGEWCGWTQSPPGWVRTAGQSAGFYSSYKPMKLKKKMQLEERKRRELISNQLLPFSFVNETSIWSPSRRPAASCSWFLSLCRARSLHRVPVSIALSLGF